MRHRRSGRGWPLLLHLRRVGRRFQYLLPQGLLRSLPMLPLLELMLILLLQLVLVVVPKVERTMRVVFQHKQHKVERQEERMLLRLNWRR